MRSGTAVLCLAAAFALVGCGLSSSSERTIRAEELARAIDRETGFDLREAPPPPQATSLYNLRQSYVGWAGAGQQLLVLVFDSPRATGQALGRPAARLPSIEVIRHANAVLLYRRGRGADRLAELRAVVEGTARRG